MIKAWDNRNVAASRLVLWESGSITSVCAVKSSVCWRLGTAIAVLCRRHRDGKGKGIAASKASGRQKRWDCGDVGATKSS